MLVQMYYLQSLLALRRRTSKWAIVVLVLLLADLGLHNLINKSVHGAIAQTQQFPSGLDCPIKDHLDACIHHMANISVIHELCGPIEIIVGSCQQRFYGMIIATKDYMADISEHTQEMIIQGADIGHALDNFVQTRSHWDIDLMGGKGYEKLTSFIDPDRIALHRELDLLQHRCDNFFYGAIHHLGFGSCWHTLGLGLAYSLYYNMTLYSPVKREYFIPVTTCTEIDVDKSFANHPPELDYNAWNNSTINFKSQHPDLLELQYRKTIIRKEYEHKGHFWWRSMLTHYATRPNAKLRDHIRQSLKVALPCISIQVRHSDKITEAPLIDFAKYMEQAYKLKEMTSVTNVYLMTDDDAVIQSSKNYSDFQFQYLEMVRTNKGWEMDIEAGWSREKQEEMFLIDLYSAVQCQQSIVTYSSNIGRLIAELSYAIRNKVPAVVSMDRDWEMDP